MNFHYPRYQELPEDLVFIDDIVALVNEVHADLPSSARNGKKGFTRSMASNYMKQGLTPPALGKKYSREHICLVLFAATIKLIGNAGGTVALSKLMFSSGDYERMQNMLADVFNQSMGAALKRAERAETKAAESCVDEPLLAELLSEAVAAKVAAHIVAESGGSTLSQP